MAEVYCGSWILSNMSNVAEIILKLFRISFSGWNNFEIISVFYFTFTSTFKDFSSTVWTLSKWKTLGCAWSLSSAEVEASMVTCELKIWNYLKIIAKLFYFTCNHALSCDKFDNNVATRHILGGIRAFDNISNFIPLQLRPSCSQLAQVLHNNFQVSF